MLENSFILPQYINGGYRCILDIEAVEDTLAEAEASAVRKAIEAKEASAIKEAVNYTSEEAVLRSFLASALEEAVLEVLEAKASAVKEVKVLEAVTNPLAKYLLVNNLEKVEALDNIASKKHLDYLEEAKASLYCFSVPKYCLKKLNCGYLAYKNDLNLKTKPSKVTFINNRFNEEKALAVTSLSFDNITNMFIIHEKDLEAFLAVVPLAEAEVKAEAEKALKAEAKEKIYKS